MPIFRMPVVFHANCPHANSPHANSPHANSPHANSPVTVYAQVYVCMYHTRKLLSYE